ncbi:thiamine phosphate synthase [Henriciella litoralis]|uniref:thiamine phosphate synthase n=1 Tax=Henriciella litoralis TaxID=568102 RepID=UPI000A065FE5|nr:thiamine phosphate synthase [Henriciella litoralis]
MNHKRAAIRKFSHAAQSAKPSRAGLPGGFFMTDSARLENPAAIIDALPPGIGVIIRHFGQANARAEAVDLVKQCVDTQRKVLIAADPDLANGTGADGVHWPFRLYRQAARFETKFGISTMSVHNSEEFRRAHQAGVDALIVSTVFKSDSPSARAPMGLMRFASIARATELPVYALGGIDVRTAQRVARFGGFASVSGFGSIVES